MKMRMRRLKIISDLMLSFLKPWQCVRSIAKMEQVLEGPFRGALWPDMCVPEILQMRVTAQNVNNAGLHEPYCELFFFLLEHESANGDAPVSSPLICVIIGGPWKRVVLSFSFSGLTGC